MRLSPEELAHTLTPGWQPWKPHRQQHKLWYHPSRFKDVYAARGAGKTDCARKYLARMLPIRKPWPDPRYFYAAPTTPQAHAIMWESLIAVIPRRWITDIEVTRMRIKTIFGSEVCVRGMDRPQRIEGIHWDGCIIDEMCDQHPKVFDMHVFPTLSHRNGWAWKTGVPKRQGIGAAHFREEIRRIEAGELSDHIALTWPSSDILPASMIQSAQSNMDAVDFAEQFGGSWQDPGGSIFHAFARSRNVRKCEYHRDRKLVVSMDFNIDPMAWVVGHRYPDRMEWFDELWLFNANTRLALDTLWSRYSSHTGGFEFFGDASSASRSTATFQSDLVQIANDKRFKASCRDVYVPPSNPAVEDRFSACNAMFCNAEGVCRMFVDPACRNLIADIEARHYKPSTRIPADVGTLGHITDAMGYAVYLLYPVTLDVDYGTPRIGTLARSRVA
jgi:hypothetical protein